MAAGKRREVFYDQVKQALLGDRTLPNLSEVSLPATNHILTTGGAQALAVEAVVEWAARNFPRSSGTRTVERAGARARAPGALQKAG
jgi:hypothetical protein